MIGILIIIVFVAFFALCGVASIDRKLEVLIKNQIELIKVLKNTDK